MSQHRLAWCLAGATLVWVYVAPCRAATLQWTAPVECPTQAAVEDRIERAIGRPLREVYGVDFEATIERRSTRAWTLELRTHARTPEGDVRERELSGATCNEVSEAAVLAMTLAISERTAAANSEIDSRPEPWEQPPEPRTQPSTANLNAPQAPPNEEPEETKADGPPPLAAAPVPLEFSAAIVAVLDTTLLPSVAVGAGLEFSIRYGLLKAILFGELFAEQEVRLDERRGGRFDLAAAGGLLCLQPSAEGLWMLGCAGSELGQLSAEGLVDRPRDDTAALRAVRVELGGGYRFSARLGAFARFGVSAPLQAAKFTVDEDRQLHRLGPLSGRALAGVELFL